MSDLLSWLVDEIVIAIINLISLFYDGLVSLAALIPVPAAFTEAEILMQQLPSEVMYFVYLLQIPYGLSLIITSLTARFALNRII